MSLRARFEKKCTFGKSKVKFLVLNPSANAKTKGTVADVARAAPSMGFPARNPPVLVEAITKGQTGQKATTIELKPKKKCCK